MNNAVILSAKRTPIGAFLGSLSSLSSTKLGSIAIEGALLGAALKPEQIDEVIMGQVLQGGVGQAPARQAALGAGLKPKTPCTTVNKVCGSGLKAIMLAAQSIYLGETKFAIAGGMESMSQAPYILPQARTGFRMGNQRAVDLMIHDGLFDPYGQSHMGRFGDQCATEFKFSREAQDDYAKNSYLKARAAAQNGWVKDEICSVVIKSKNEEKIISEDEEPGRFAPEKMSLLRPAFSETGSVTAANASKINDGAAAVVIASESAAREGGHSLLGRIVGMTTYAAEPQWFTTAPAAAIAKLCAKTSILVKDIDLFEINEAFSVVAMHSIKELGLDEARVNVFGGAVALGHPIGSTGARLVVTLLNALRKKNKRLGCIAVCLGGGEAVSMLIERIEE